MVKSPSSIKVLKTPNKRKSLGPVISRKNEFGDVAKKKRISLNLNAKLSDDFVVTELPKSVKKAKKSLEVVKTPKSEKKLVKKQVVKSASKSVKKASKLIVNTPNLDESKTKFDLKLSNIKKAIEGVLKFVENNPKIKNDLFNETYSIFIKVVCFKIPKGYQKIFRIPMSNSLYTPDDDICLIVPDVKEIKNKEHEQHQQHYEEILRNCGVNNIKKIMTFHEFRTEYENFELRNRLADLYELFLVDGRIAGKVVQKAGKIFYKKRKVPVPIKMEPHCLKRQVESAMKKAYFHVNLKSDNYSLQFGHSKMDVDEMAENVIDVAEFLTKNFPGGYENIRSLYIYSERSPSVPIYVALAPLADIKVPVLKNKLPKAYETVKGELSTKLNSEVTVKPEGNIILTLKGRNKSQMKNNTNKPQKRKSEQLSNGKAKNESKKRKLTKTSKKNIKVVSKKITKTKAK